MLEKYGIRKLKKDNGPPPTVVVGMSGGVDSSVAAYILKWQGYNVIGLFMKNWEETGADGFCPSEVDFADVKRVAEVIGIPYYSVNFSKQYMDNVFKIFLDGLSKGVTPNPDILCNREVKFGPFLQRAFEIGADFVATGHYARVNDGKLLKGVDENKDQSYFLCGLSKKQISKVMFPIGGLLKSQVREIAKEANLVTANKKDSTGICFIGERKFKEFMKGYLGNQTGEIKTLDGKTVGRHEGLMYYTLGQRKGLGVGGTSENTDRWFVVRKDLGNNTLYVNNGECPEMYTREVVTRGFNWIGEKPVRDNDSLPRNPVHSCVSNWFDCNAKVRYRQADQKCMAVLLDDGGVKAVFEKPQRAVTSGQWMVLYDGDICLGGGEIQ